MSYTAHPVPPLSPTSALASKEWRDAYAFLKDLADKPKPAAWEDHWEWEMPQIHVLIFHWMERIYAYADSAVEHDDLANYLGFAECAIYQIHSHHWLEENVIFPGYTKATGLDVWQVNVEEHHTFGPALDALLLYLHRQRLALKPAPAPTPMPPLPEETSTLDVTQFPDLNFDGPFSAESLRKHIDSFALPLAKHLSDEIGTVKRQYISQVGKETEDRLHDEAVKHLMKYDPAWFLCFSMASADADTLRALFPLPWMVRKVLVPFWWSGKNGGMWRYCPNPENLTWAGSI